MKEEELASLIQYKRMKCIINSNETNIALIL